ncbi:MAG: lipoprotein [Candidatus Paceibacterota bacterium]
MKRYFLFLFSLLFLSGCYTQIQKETREYSHESTVVDSARGINPHILILRNDPYLFPYYQYPFWRENWYPFGLYWDMHHRFGFWDYRYNRPWIHYPPKWKNPILSKSRPSIRIRNDSSGERGTDRNKNRDLPSREKDRSKKDSPRK